MPMPVTHEHGIDLRCLNIVHKSAGEDLSTFLPPQSRGDFRLALIVELRVRDNRYLRETLIISRLELLVSLQSLTKAVKPGHLLLP